jgi:exodeoxyribonuclease III
MKIATFNVNGIAARLPRLLEWLDETRPDVACLQEIKCLDDNFPRLEFESRGWHLETHGQKGFNGVALLSRTPMLDVRRGLPGNPEDEQARWIEASIAGVRVISLYLPNGNPQPGPKFDYKLDWMERLMARAKALLAAGQPLVLAGDFNVCPTDEDCYDPAAMATDALLQPESRARFRQLCHLGLTDATRTQQPAGRAYTFWDYQAGAWPKDNGVRIDFLLLSPDAADRLSGSGIDRKYRGMEKSSDHTPVWATLDIIAHPAQYEPER